MQYHAWHLWGFERDFFLFLLFISLCKQLCPEEHFTELPAVRVQCRHAGMAVWADLFCLLTTIPPENHSSSGHWGRTLCCCGHPYWSSVSDGEEPVLSPTTSKMPLLWLLKPWILFPFQNSRKWTMGNTFIKQCKGRISIDFQRCILYPFFSFSYLWKTPPTPKLATI